MLCSRNAFRDLYPRHDCPAESTIRRLVVKFESTSSIINQPIPARHRNAKSYDNIVSVHENKIEITRKSISRRSQELNLFVTLVWRILRRDLGPRSYNLIGPGTESK